MYDFDDKGGRRLALRPEGTASVVARVRAAPPGRAVEGLVRRAATSATSGRRRAATASTGRSASRCSASTTRRRRRGHRARARLLPGDLGLRDVTLLHQLDGRRRRPRPRTSRCCATYLLRARRRCSATTFRERVEANPLRILDSKDARLAGRDRARAADHRVPQRRRGRAHFEAVQDGLARARDRVRDRRRGSCAGSTTTRAPRSSSRATRSTPRRTRIGGGGRYDGLVEEMGGKPTPGIGFGIGIERVLIACDAEGVLPGAAADASTCSSSTASATPTEVTLLVDRAARGRACAPSARTAAARSKQQWRRPTGRARAARVMLGARRGRARRGRGEGPAVRRAGRGAARSSSRAGCGNDAKTEDTDAMMRTASGRRSPGRPTSAATVVVCGWVAAVATTAASCSSTCATSPASCRSWSTRATTSAPTSHRVRSEWVRAGRRATVRHRPEGTVNDDLPTGEVEVARDRGRGAQRGRAAAVPARRPHRRRRGAAPAAPLPRPAPPADAAQPARARRR